MSKLPCIDCGRISPPVEGGEENLKNCSLCGYPWPNDFHKGEILRIIGIDIEFSALTDTPERREWAEWRKSIARVDRRNRIRAEALYELGNKKEGK